ncbi:P-loop containing nucleoside triphosphate hydrolase protein [Podospora fimiseda]|uniref:P-loop containing nucleoside triphosphate hydrolase protein n=1 Tax=Podospora fimiseda TaxID=252190 RepID=A0AAN7BXK3_9PEZI|nr:P-loop containing nucleoside triphosphate hydrolase protein [Podospora fimiseda]
MSTLPIFAATHPRACSTAFERVFMTRSDILHCIHEPFGDAFYYGPERLSERFENDEEARKKSGFAEVTYKDVLDQILDPKASEGKRIFIKDIAHYLLPSNKQKASIAPSLRHLDNTPTTNGTTNDVNGINGTHHLENPTVLPLPLLSKFHFTFLIRHPCRAIPSYYRCTIPPLSSKTGFPNFMPSEAGYDELRRLFDYLLSQSLLPQITVIDADDLLDHPEEIIKIYCQHVGIDFSTQMLKWDGEEAQRKAVEQFEKWNGFHDDAIGSTGLKPRVVGKKVLTREEEDEQWREKYGEEGQKIIRETVDANLEDYEYLKGFAVKV